LTELATGTEELLGTLTGAEVFLSSQPMEAARKAATTARLRNFFMEINPFNKCGKKTLSTTTQ